MTERLRLKGTELIDRNKKLERRVNSCTFVTEDSDLTVSTIDTLMNNFALILPENEENKGEIEYILSETPKEITNRLNDNGNEYLVINSDVNTLNLSTVEMVKVYRNFLEEIDSMEIFKKHCDVYNKIIQNNLIPKIGHLESHNKKTNVELFWGELPKSNISVFDKYLIFQMICNSLPKHFDILYNNNFYVTFVTTEGHIIIEINKYVNGNENLYDISGVIERTIKTNMIDKYGIHEKCFQDSMFKIYDYNSLIRLLK